MPDETMPESERRRPLTVGEREKHQVEEALRIAREEQGLSEKRKQEIREEVEEKPIMGGQGPGEEEAGRRMIEGAPVPEAARLYGERIGLYPMEGRDLVELISEAEIEEGGDVSEISGVFRQALAFREGLIFGPEGENIYDLKDTAELIYLHNLFTTVEGSTARPNVFYLDSAIKEALGRRVREAEQWHQNEEWWEKRLRRRFKRLREQREREGRAPLSEKEINNAIEQERRLMKNTYEAVPKLLELQNRVEARGVLDRTFVQRMETCEDPGSASSLLNRDRRYQPPVTPDKGHWDAFFQGGKEGEFGHEVNKVFWEIVKFGLDDEVIKRLGLEPIPPEIRKERVRSSIYADGFDRIPVFSDWLSYLLKTANNRMDIVWNAWKLALTWEITSELGIKTTKEGKYKVAIPPIGNALLVWTAHLEEQRAAEFGLTKDDKRLKDQVGKYVTHSGLSMSLGKFPPLCRSFLHESRPRLRKEDLEKLPEDVLKNLRDKLPKPGDPIHNPDYEEYDRGESYNHRKLRERFEEVQRGEIDPETNKPKELEISLWDLWLYGGLSFADEKFPWFLTEKIEPGETPGELSAGSFGGWLLKRSRCLGERGGVLIDIRMRPSIRELADPDFFASRVRTWDKVLGAVKNVSPDHKDYLPPEKNPRAWWMAGLIWYHIGGTKTKSQLTIKKPLRDYRTVSGEQVLSATGEAAEAKRPTIGDIFRHARNCGFLRKEDINWIISNLSIRLL